MTVEIRPVTPEELGEMGILGGYAYGGAFGDGPNSAVAKFNKPEWTSCAFVDGKLASSFANAPFTMRANGRAVKLAGVGAIATQPEYRRQGLARRIHTQAFGEMREAGQNVAALWASQAAIYQRYGYAMTTVMREYAVDTQDIRFHDGDDGSGRVARVDVDTARDVVKTVYAAFIANRMCYLHRIAEDWVHYWLKERDDTGPVWVAVCYGADATARGYVIYTLRSGRVDHRARDQELVIRDLAWLDADAYRSLWRFLACHDLVGRVCWASAPADDPADEFFEEPRLLNAADHEGAWFRLVDAANALAERGYDVEGELTISLAADPLTPWNDGRWHLQAGPDGAQCRPSKAVPDIELTTKALASLYTGFRSATELNSWGLLDGDRRALAKADALFRTRHAPHTPDEF
ncbi:MAG: GNAT family N-acetyltransferase [Gammaproteobacteria bacterium]|nr:GNAT family N-acetyltransferase [Gammaproteobacteria bacterium]